MTKFEPVFPSHFYRQGASHTLPCISSASGADGWRQITTSILSLRSFAFQEGFIGNLIRSHWFGPVPALNEKWPVSHFISPSKIHRECLAVCKRKSPAQAKSAIRSKTQLFSPSPLHRHRCRADRILLVFSISARNPPVHARKEHTHFFLQII